MANTIYVFSGYSGAGKDTAAAAVPHSVAVKFAAPAKRALEKIYSLPEGFLDDRELRQQIAPHSGGRTYLEVLIAFWEHRDKVIGKELFPLRVKEQILEVLGSGQDVTINDMRNKNEGAVLKDLANLGYTLNLYWICGGSPLDSDLYSWDILNGLVPYSETKYVLYIQNPQTGITAFQQQIRDILPKWVDDSHIV